MGKFYLFIGFIFFPAIIYAKPVTHAVSEIVNSDNQVIGKAEFFQGADGVLIKWDVKGLSPGYHGAHFTQIGDCSNGKGGFIKAGDAIISENREHGLLSDKGPHAADLPNLYFHHDMKAVAEFYTEMVSLNGQDFKDELLDEDGSSIVIHELEDDHVTQPEGNSGRRIACGVIKGL